MNNINIMTEMEGLNKKITEITKSFKTIEENLKEVNVKTARLGKILFRKIFIKKIIKDKHFCYIYKTVLNNEIRNFNANIDFINIL